jgi:cholesterol transport system auxiliary component
MAGLFAPLSRRAILAGSATLAIAGCADLIGPPPAPQIYALDPEFTSLADAPNVSWQLVVAQPTAPQVLDTQRIALERAPNIMDYYANAQWPDSLTALLQSLLIEAFEKSGKVSAVGRESAGLRADYVLSTEIRNFEAFYQIPDSVPKIRVILVAKILGAVSHNFVGAKQVQREAQATANDLVSITAAFRDAARMAVEDIVGWTLRASNAKP